MRRRKLGVVEERATYYIASQSPEDGKLSSPKKKTRGRKEGKKERSKNLN